MTYPNVCLRRGEASGVRSGQTLIFENELDWADDTCTDGCVVDVLDERLQFTARGFFNSRSKITVRVLTRDKAEDIDEDFFRRRIASAWQTRKALGFENSCRVVFGETDGLPGLTVDKFADYLSLQITCLGLERWKSTIVRILEDLFSPKGIYERDDLPVREKEGLPQIKACLSGSVPEEIEIREHDAKMLVSIPNGQKTGHFLDQQENRGRIRPYCGGRTVLDLCCCTGGFSIHAALYGAAHLTAVDVSEQALCLVRKNAALNSVEDKITTVCENVFDLAKAWSDEGRTCDLRPARLRQKPQSARRRLPRLQGAEPSLHENGRARRLSRLVLVQPVHDARIIPCHAPRSRPRFRPRRAFTRNSHAVPRPPRLPLVRQFSLPQRLHSANLLR